MPGSWRKPIFRSFWRTGLTGRRSYLKHLECSVCKSVLDPAAPQTVCDKCGKALFARYDLLQASRFITPAALKDRPPSLWRYRELLPVVDDASILSLGEGWTPVIPLKRLAVSLGLASFCMKDESFNVTGSFKARGLCMALSKAGELGVREVCLPTAGNAGGAAAAYAAAAGMRAHVYMPEDTPRINIDECRLYGADVHLVPGVISDAAKKMVEEKQDWFDLSTLKEPYRLEGKKTMGYEVAEQYGWKLPDVILYPTGGGTGLIGMWKAFDELEALGWIGSKRPKMISVQSAGCAPIVKAFHARARSSEFWKDAVTIASGLRVPKAFADHLILDALSASGGDAIAVEDAAIVDALRTTARDEGVLLSPEGAACVAAAMDLVKSDDDWQQCSMLFFNTASAFKYVEVLSLASQL